MSYLAPTNITEALDFLTTHQATIVAGCTDHFPSRRADQTTAPLLDVSRLDGFRGIAETPDGWRIGAATTWTDVIRAPLPRGFDALKLAAREVGSVQIQNRGTVAGNICNASPAADGVPPLLALDAEVEIVSPARTRQVPLSDFITGVRSIALGVDELVAAILVPRSAVLGSSAFLKLGSRTHLVISIAMVAAVVDVAGGAIRRAAVAVGSCAPLARRLPALETALVGARAADVAAMDFAALDVWDPLSPITDVRGSSAYRSDVVAELSRRAVLDCLV